MSSFRPALLALSTVAAIGFSLSSAAAATQVLGLVASNGAPTPLVCADGRCSAQFSSFCLQQSRPAPSRGDDYAVAAGGRLTLIARTVAGQTLRIPANDLLQVHSFIGFTSVEISLPKAKLAELGASAVAVDVGPAVSLVPLATADDRNPQTDDELALATGPMRLAATPMFEAPGTASDAARIATVLINALPAKGLESAEDRNELWVAMVDSPAVTGATPGGREAAAQMYEACKIAVESHSAFSMRNCLELRHADLLAETNHEFWKDTVGY
jgi:hypothetical protein